MGYHGRRPTGSAAGGRAGGRRLLPALLALIWLLTPVAPVMAQDAAPTPPDGTPEAPPAIDPQPQVRGVTQVDTPAARLLAERYRPILMLRQRDAMCTGDGEPYLPVPVDLVFDNPAVRLRENSGRSDFRDPVLTVAPAVTDIAAADAGTYLDFPGDPRNPRCAYERWYRATMPEHEPTTYARVLEADGTHVVVQYHLFYVFNDYNNRHEGDWEMIQLLFEAESVEVAQLRHPVEVAYAQHAGGEAAGWESGKLERRGPRPVVYVSQGSHAAHFGSATWLGWGERGTGFGCDNTLGSHREIEPTVAMLSVPPVDPDDPGVWLDWRGRWGERQTWEYDGPVGPRRTKRWTDPVGWQQGLRGDSIAVPGSSLLGPAPTDVFCGVTRYGSLALMQMVGRPWYVLAVLALPLAAVGWLIWLSWSTVLGAVRVYLRYLPVFAVIGLLVIPIGIVSGWLYDLAIRFSSIRDLVDLTERTAVSYYLAAMPIASLQQVLSLLIVAPAVLEVYRAIERGESITVGRMASGVHRHVVPMLRAIVRPYGKVLLAQLTVVGLPWAIHRVVRWGFVAQAVVLDDVPPADAARRSAETVRGRWWRTAATLLVFAVLGVAAGPVLGIVLMTQTSTAVQDVNALSSLIYAVLLPLSVLGSTMLYRQRQGRRLPPSAYEQVRKRRATMPRPAARPILEGDRSR